MGFKEVRVGAWNACDLRNTYNRISFTVMLMLILMMVFEPMLACANAPDWPTDQCPEATANSLYWYSVFGMVAMIVHWLLLIDMLPGRHLKNRGPAARGPSFRRNCRPSCWWWGMCWAR